MRNLEIGDSVFLVSPDSLIPGTITGQSLTHYIVTPQNGEPVEIEKGDCVARFLRLQNQPNEPTPLQVKFLRVLQHDEANRTNNGYRCGWTKAHGYLVFPVHVVEPLITCGLVFECPPFTGWNHTDHGIAGLSEHGKLFLKNLKKSK